jgi:8-oxo-dGTP pyrophosphatase MutT (NUDIX family)
MFIRNIAICLIEHDNKLFVGEGRDDVKGETFYRPLGGGIEFGELAAQTAIREFKEELNAEIQVLSYCSTLENIFEFNGIKAHQIVIVLQARFVDSAFYGLDNITCIDDNGEFVAKWIDKEEFYSGRKILYPAGLTAYLKNQEHG